MVSSLKLLVVGAEECDAAIIQDVLPHSLVCMTPGWEDACKLLDQHSDVSLLILDIEHAFDTIPSLLDAFQTLASYPQIGLMLLSPASVLPDALQELKLIPSSFLLKPLESATLCGKIDAYLEEREHLLEEEKLQEQALLFNAIFHQAPIGIAISHGIDRVAPDEQEVFQVNHQFEEITGWKQDELSRLGWAKITHPDDLEEDTMNFRRLQSGKINGYSLEKRYLKPDGSVVWVYMVLAPLLLKRATLSTHICLIQDITKRKQAEQSLFESERSKSVLLSHLPGMAYRCRNDADWTMLFVSEGCKALTGYEAQSLLGNRDLSFNDLIIPTSRLLIRREWDRVLACHEVFQFEYEIIAATGERKWVWEMGQGLYSETDAVTELEGLILDISDRKRFEQELKYHTEHDLLTGLYNRRYLEGVLHADAQEKLAGRRALISVNVSTLHISSLTYGFQYTQDILLKVAQVLQDVCAASNLVCKTHEYRFVIYVQGYADVQDLTAFCKKVSNALQPYLSLEGISWGFGVLEISEENKDDEEQLLRNLLVASERALSMWDKEVGLCFFDSQMAIQLEREEEITTELSRLAAGEGESTLYLQFQPIIDLVSNSICSFEALARLRTPTFGLIGPLEFIPIAEKTKLIIPLGESIILQAFRFLHTLEELGFSKVAISINISAIQLLNHGFIPNLMRHVKAMDVEPDQITLEITESVFASNYQEINRILGQLQATGIKVSMDDFGTGYSSLARERELNINCLKIDKYFIDKLMEIQDDQAITGDIISMAHKLGHCVIAEGIEHERQKTYLARYGCDKIQGYLVSRPLDEKDALQFLRNWKV
ncbi:MAG: EAL domain-containing protein [Sphaerochaeta sp.]|jgi:PAS domain S-box-containing protein|uniref:sensor domain-containing protein n=1 Tax=Sphaerochaeta sp. TaxID=1972642 RepID=UPI002FCB182A